MSFDMAHAFTARWEGGLTDHPADPGGITNHGVSLRWLQQLAAEAAADCRRAGCSCDGSNAFDTSDDLGAHENTYDFNHDGTIDSDDIRECTKVQAAELMRRHFWLPLGCEALPAALGTTLYDCAVNTGPAQAVKILQQCCNTVGEAQLDVFTPLNVDGRCGPLTRALAQALGEAGLDFYTARLCVRQRRDFYVRLCRQKSHLAPFLKGWKNRCESLLEHLASMEREV